MGFAFLSMIIASTIEVVRHTRCDGGIDTNVKDDFFLFIFSYHSDAKLSDIHVYYLLPQNFALGFSQLFAMVASYEYAYLAAPLSAQSLFMSLHFCSAGIAQFIGVAYAVVIDEFGASTNFGVSIKP